MSGDATEAQRGQHSTPKASGDAFISYASQDKGVADAVCKALESAGVACWIAPRNVTPGEVYAESIVHAIDSARVAVLVLSQHTANSQHVLREVERASSKRHPVVTFRTDAAALPAGLEYFLNSSQWLDASAGVHRALPKLVDAVRSALAQSSGAARVERAHSVTARMSRQWRGILIALAAIAVVALGYVLVDRIWPSQPVDEQQASTAPMPGAQAAVSSAPAIPDQSIAVLPFIDMSEKKDQEYFADGMAEQLIDVLVKVPGLHVPARTSTFYFKDKQATIADIAEALHVAHVLEGSVRKAGNTLRITVQLIRVDTGNHLWSETYDRQLEDVFAIQDDIAAAVVERLKVTLLDEAPKAQRTDPKAFALTLQARQAHRLASKEGWDRAISLYQQALTIDPGYGAASDGLATIYLNQGSLGLRPETEAVRLAREVVNKALAIHPDDALALAKLGSIVNAADNDLAAAARHVERALALEPENPFILGNAARILQSLGRFDQGVALMEYLVERDPLNPIGHSNLGVYYRVAGRLDDAIASHRTAINLAPRAVGMHSFLGIALLLKGEGAAALDEMRLEASEPIRLLGLAVAFHDLGQKAESDATLEELIDKYGRGWACEIAFVLAYRGEADRTFEWLDKAIQYHDEGLSTVYPTQQWAFGKIQDDPRWLPFLRRIGRAPEQLAAIRFAVKLPK